MSFSIGSLSPYIAMISTLGFFANTITSVQARGVRIESVILKEIPEFRVTIVSPISPSLVSWIVAAATMVYPTIRRKSRAESRALAGIADKRKMLEKIRVATCGIFIGINGLLNEYNIGNTQHLFYDDWLFNTNRQDAHLVYRNYAELCMAGWPKQVKSIWLE
jgi:hypothetical protein